jgi:hypothetical protein
MISIDLDQRGATEVVRQLPGLALSTHISGVSIVKCWSMPRDRASCIALSVSSRQSG